MLHIRFCDGQNYISLNKEHSYGIVVVDEKLVIPVGHDSYGAAELGYAPASIYWDGYTENCIIERGR